MERRDAVQEPFTNQFAGSVKLSEAEWNMVEKRAER